MSTSLWQGVLSTTPRGICRTMHRQFKVGGQVGRFTTGQVQAATSKRLAQVAVVDSLLELNVPAEIGVLVVDFYRFSDLLFWSGQAAADDDVEHGLMNAKRQLLLPNVPAGYEFPVSHIPFLSKDWILKGICAK